MIKIAIVGGGMGGLTLARILQLNDVDATVYDRDPTPDARREGGSLDLRPEHGQRALAAANLMPEFRRRIRPGGDARKILDASGAHLYQHVADDDSGHHPEIDRTQLRDLLLGGIEPERMVWGKKALSTTRVDGRPAVVFDDGSTVVADVVVGADGAWSAVRPAVSAARPAYSGVSFVELTLDNAEQRHPEAAGLVGAGSLVAMSSGQGIIANRTGDGAIRIYVSLRVPEDWSAALAHGDHERVHSELLLKFQNWSPDLMHLVSASDRAIICRPLYQLPVDHEWSPVPGVTLLGDAAHLMTPFGGYGANLAMLDATELGEAMVAHVNDTNLALTTYESRLFPRSQKFATETRANLELYHGPDAPRRIAAKFTELRQA